MRFTLTRQPRGTAGRTVLGSVWCIAGLFSNITFAEVTATAETPPAVAAPAAAPAAVPNDAITPDRLVLVATFGQESVVRYLLERGVDVNAKDIFGNTALIGAAGAGQTAVVEQLLAAGASPAVQNRTGDTALAGAAAHGDHAIVRRLLAAGADLNAKNSRGETALFLAVQYGHRDSVVALLEAGADPNVQNTLPVSAVDSAYTPLMYAAQHGLRALDGDWPAMARALLDKGANPNLTSTHGASALSVAQRTADQPLIALLQERGARKEIAYTSLSPEEALIKASTLGDLAKVRTLFADGVRANINDAAGINPLLAAVYQGHTAIVQELLANGAEADRVPLGLREWALSAARTPMGEEGLLNAAARGDTALIIAIRRHHIETVRALLAHGANPTLANRQNDQPLLVTAELGHERIARLLLAQGVNPNSAEKANRASAYASALSTIGRNTALIKAAQGGHAETVAVLLEAGADPNLRGFMGKTALFWAVERGYAPVVLALLERRADPNLYDASGLSPLMLAATHGNVQIVDLLLRYKADVNRVAQADRGTRGEKIFGTEGATALISAAVAGHQDIVRRLIEHGAALEMANASGHTALQEAHANRHQDVVQVLKEAGAKDTALVRVEE